MACDFVFVGAPCLKRGQRPRASGRGCPAGPSLWSKGRHFFGERSGLHPSQLPFGLFAARGRAAAFDIGEACGRGRDAWRRRHRHGQSFRRAGVLREGSGGRHSADHRREGPDPLRGRPGIRGSAAGPQRRSRHVAPLFLLAATDQGYRRLINLVTDFYLGEAGRAEPVALDTLAAASSGIIAMTGGHDGLLYPVLRRGDKALAEARIESLTRIFGDRLYCRARAARAATSRFEAEPALIDLAYRHDLPLVATNEAVFPGARRFRSARRAARASPRARCRRGRPPAADAATIICKRAPR